MSAKNERNLYQEKANNRLYLYKKRNGEKLTLATLP